MGLHPLDILIVVLLGMLIFGSQALQKWASSAGKTMKQVNELKDQVLSELPVQELSEVTNKLSRIPTSPQQVAARLLMPEREQAAKSAETQKNE